MTDYLKMYIAVLDEVPDFIAPTLVAHSVLSAHLLMEKDEQYQNWLKNYFRKAVVRVNRKEFEKIGSLELLKHFGYENKTLDAENSCIVVQPVWNSAVPNVLKFAKLWSPKELT